MSPWDKFENWIARQSGNPVTPILTLGSIAATVAGLIWGLKLDSTGLWLNVSASLVLLGPAALVSNFVIAYALRVRSDRRAELSLGVVNLILLQSIDTANDLLRLLSHQAIIAKPDFTRNLMVDLHGALEAMQQARPLIKQVVDARGLPPGSIAITGENFTLPDFKSIPALIALIDRETPSPFVVLAAAAMSRFSESVYVDFVFRATNPSPLRPLNQPEPGVWEPKIGFAEIGAWLTRGLNAKNPAAVGVGTFYLFADGCLEMSEKLLELLIDAVPPRLIAPNQKD